MAVTITRAQLAARMRLGRTQTELEEVDNLLAEATEAVIRLAPNCPDVIHNMAVWRFCSYSYDRPFGSADTRFSNVMRNSGAAAALLPYRVHRLGLSGGDAMDSASAGGTAAGNAVTGLEIVGGNIVLTFGDGSTSNVPLPPSIGGVSVANVEYNSGTDMIDVTYSDGSMISFAPAPGTLRWPGL